MDELKNEIEKIKERNTKVAFDKAWETSTFRVASISIMTYICVVIFLCIIKTPNPFINALVPMLGYFLSAQSLPFIKKWWIRKESQKIEVSSK
jgi:hypothetical protein